MSEKLKTSSALISNFELKIQKQHSHLRFKICILIHIDTSLNMLNKVTSSAYLTLTPLMLISEGVWKTSGVFNLDFKLKIQKQDLHFALL